LPQTRLEPILVRHANLAGFTVRFDTTFLSFEKEPSGALISKVKDNITNQIYYIKSKYLFGADGARSQVLRQLKIPLAKKPGQGLAINVLVKVDLSHTVENRMGNLHWIMQPDKEFPIWGWTAIARMVKPWNE
jgi:flavin-dependent dehydrogenase